MKKPKKNSNRSISLFTYVFFLLFLGMIGYYVYFLYADSETFASNSHNPRLQDSSANVIRGSIESSNGKVLASTETAEDGTELRDYPYGRVFAHIIGYSTNGMGGLERTENDLLLTSHADVKDQVKNELKKEKSPGDTVVTTLDTDLQEAVYNAMQDKQGAFIAMDPDTGAILASVSKPDFNPNTISDDWSHIVSDDNDSSVLVNRAIQGKYAPGSTFKIVTALEYLREGGSLEDNFSCSGSIERDGYTAHCFNNKAHGNQSLLKAFGNSCNVAFSTIGLELDISKYRDTAQDLLLNTDVPDPFGTASNSSFALMPGTKDSTIMATAFGQGQTLVTPYNMMLIASAIANDGELMTPYVVEEIKNVDGVTVKKTSVKSYGRLMTTNEAETLTGMMRYVVTNGTGKAINLDNCDVYGKTGTAEFNDNGDSHSWFVGFSEKDGKKAAFACIVEGTSSNKDPKSMPVVHQFLNAYYK